MTSNLPAESTTAVRPARLRIGVIGAGAIGRHHIDTVVRTVPEATVASVYDPVQEAAASVAATAGAQVAGHPEEILTSPNVDAVLVCSPDDTHLELVLGAVRAGKHVLCEKPLAQTPEETRRIVDAELALGTRVVQVGFMRRFDPDYRRLKGVVERGDAGETVMMHCVHRNPWSSLVRTAADVVENSMVHEMDAARWLTGEEVARVRARPVVRGGAWRVGDPVLAWLDLVSGATIEIEVFVNAGYGYEIGCELVGSRATASLPRGVFADFQGRFAPAYQAELAAWVDDVTGGAQSGASAWDGHRAAVIAAACVRSLSTGDEVEVEHEQRPDLYR